jgi:deoxyribodipyrimidine photo-lyase
MIKRSIVWFTTDLRLTDNETLVKAIEQSEEIIPVYCLDERFFQTNEFDLRRMGNFRLQFLFEALSDLDNQLRKKGSGLLFCIGQPEVLIPAIVKEWGVQKVFTKKEVASEEKNLQAIIEKKIWEEKCLFETFSTSTLYHAVDLPFGIRDIPEVFTNFRKRVEKDSSVRKSFSVPEIIYSPTIEPLKLPDSIEFGYEPTMFDERSVLAFKGGETAGKERVHYYLFESKAISTYKTTRNGLIGADYSSKFSPWLTLGCISPKWIYWQIQTYESTYGGNESTYWLIFELLWRDYFRFMMKKHGDKFFMRHGFNGNTTTESHTDETLFKKWIKGETGNDFIDANMKELLLTGFMSNRGRQNVASYLIDELKLDWRMGASYFEQQLIDYDVSSNWGNWAYLAGVGNDPRGKRIFNSDKQAAEYDPKGKYRNLWLKKVI